MYAALSDSMSASSSTAADGPSFNSRSWMPVSLFVKGSSSGKFPSATKEPGSDDASMSSVTIDVFTNFRPGFHDPVEFVCAVASCAALARLSLVRQGMSSLNVKIDEIYMSFFWLAP